ncbi:hypothetical protein [Cetobacterium sp.]
MELEKNEFKFLEDNKVYNILEGKVLVRYIFSDGKVVNNEVYLESGDMVGNFFKIFNIYGDMTKDLAIEIEALENTKLLVNSCEDLISSLEKDKLGMLKNLVEQMLKKQLINILHHKYGKKGYILATLLLHSNEEGDVQSSFLNHERFNLSRSQFFLTMGELKKDCIVVKYKKGIRINRNEAEKYLELEG